LREPVSCGCAAHPGGDRRRLLASCCAGACERRGTVRTGISPDSSVGLPANRRSRAVVLVGCGSQLAVGGLCTQEATAGACWLPAARVLTSGEERFVQASSRIVLSVCRLILAAVPRFRWLGDGDACAARVNDVGARRSRTATGLVGHFGARPSTPPRLGHCLPAFDLSVSEEPSSPNPARPLSAWAAE